MTCLVDVDHVDLLLRRWPRTLVMVDFWNAKIFVEWRYHLRQLLHVIKQNPAFTATVSPAQLTQQYFTISITKYLFSI